jgi:hypothetical protein
VVLCRFVWIAYVVVENLLWIVHGFCILITHCLTLLPITYYLLPIAYCLLQALHGAVLLVASNMKEKKLGEKMDIDEGDVSVELPVISDAVVPTVAPTVAKMELLEATLVTSLSLSIYI